MTYINPEISTAKKDFLLTGKTLPLAFRINALKQLLNAIKSNEQEILNALQKDLGKPVHEAFSSEIAAVCAEINIFIKNLGSWIRPEKVSTPAFLFPSKSFIYKQPLGVSLIIAPWNYPFQLSLIPLVGAIGAGNCAVIKPSEEAPVTAAIVEKIVAQTFPENYISVIQGNGAEVVTELLDKHQFDHIFFTGSKAVGTIIARKAAEKLLPVTLELGGKSPVIVHEDTDLEVAAKRIVFGKYFNAGQTCVSPDYALVQERIFEKFLQALKNCIKNFYGDNPDSSKDYGRIINRRRFDKLVSYLSQGKVCEGGVYKAEDLYISPTLLCDVDMESPVMYEEIFGPVLPVIAFRDKYEAVKIISKNPDPLALYIFTSDKSIENFYIHALRYGGGCINDMLVHLINPNLPFGGIGSSGLGHYHGRYSFDAFTHRKAILKNTVSFDHSLRYPPYKDWKTKVMRLFMK